MHVGITKCLQCNAQHLNIYKDLQNKDYAPGLALSRCKVRGVSCGWLLELLRHEDLPLVLLDDFLLVRLLRGHVLNFLVIYMHAMIMRHLKIVTTEALITTITTNYLANSNG
jgi:hypothetical protein